MRCAAAVFRAVLQRSEAATIAERGSRDDLPGVDSSPIAVAKVLQKLQGYTADLGIDDILVAAGNAYGFDGVASAPCPQVYIVESSLREWGTSGRG